MHVIDKRFFPLAKTPTGDASVLSLDYKRLYTNKQDPPSMS